MTIPVINPVKVALDIAEALDANDVPYAIGGALAYGVWAVARGTMDVDLNLFVSPSDLSRALDVLESTGTRVDREDAQRQALDGGQFIGWKDECQIDVFTPSIDFSWEALRTRKRASIIGRPAWFLSAEALCVFKLLFFRGKDLVDLERLIGTQGERLDSTYVRRWISEIMGEDDERVAKWDELITKNLP